MAEGYEEQCTEIDMPNSQMDTSKKETLFLKDHMGGVYTKIESAANVQINGRMTVYMGSDRGSYNKRKIKAKKPLTVSTDKIKTDQMLNIKDRLGADWKDLGRRLGFDDAELEQKRLEYKDDLRELNYQILCGWLQRKPESATQAILANIFNNMYRGDLADLLAEDA